jgi:leucyl aminopeptidase (aminopeptidase T)
MPKTTSGGAVPNVAKAATKSWQVFRYYNPASARDPRLSYITGYQRAVADMLVDQFRFGGWDELTRRMLDVFEYLADQREAVRIVGEEVPGDRLVQDEDPEPEWPS